MGAQSSKKGDMEPANLLFPFAEAWPLYLGFLVLVLGLLALDLGVFHKKDHVVSFKEAAVWSVVWVTLAMVFNAALYGHVLWNHGPEDATRISLEFLTGFIVEKSLAVDNIFVFAVVFTYFGIPTLYQHRVLFYGILGALIFRAIFIAAGSVLMQYHIVVIIFGVFLILTGVKLLFAPEQKVDPEKNLAIRLLKKFVPITPQLEGNKFFVRKNGKLWATPLFVALFFLEMTDIIFAFDSVPAIFAVTKEPFIVFTSNIFAILGLRSLYFMLAGVMDKFHYLKYGLGLVLVFVGLKMTWLNDLFDGKFPIGWSLGIIAVLIGGSIALSLFLTRKADKVG